MSILMQLDEVLDLIVWLSDIVGNGSRVGELFKSIILFPEKWDRTTYTIRNKSWKCAGMGLNGFQIR